MADTEIEVFNLTDVETPLLRQHHAVGITFAAGRLLLSPGGSGKTVGDAMTRAQLMHYVTIGAAAVDKLPPHYVLARDRMQKHKADPARSAETKKKDK